MELLHKIPTVPKEEKPVWHQFCSVTGFAVVVCWFNWNITSTALSQAVAIATGKWMRWHFLQHFVCMRSVRWPWGAFCVQALSLTYKPVQMFHKCVSFCRCVQAWASGGHVVGTTLHWHTVPLPLPLLAGPWSGKMEPSAGPDLIFHHAVTLYIHAGIKPSRQIFRENENFLECFINSTVLLFNQVTFWGYWKESILWLDRIRFSSVTLLLLLLLLYFFWLLAGLKTRFWNYCERVKTSLRDWLIMQCGTWADFASHDRKQSSDISMSNWNEQNWKVCKSEDG